MLELETKKWDFISDFGMPVAFARSYDLLQCNLL